MNLGRVGISESLGRQTQDCLRGVMQRVHWTGFHAWCVELCSTILGTSSRWPEYRSHTSSNRRCGLLSRESAGGEGGDRWGVSVSMRRRRARLKGGEVDENPTIDLNIGTALRLPKMKRSDETWQNLRGEMWAQSNRVSYFFSCCRVRASR